MTFRKTLTILATALAVAAAGGSAVMAQTRVLMLFCSHSGHGMPPGKGARVEGVYYRIADCDEAAAAHKSNHGISERPFYVQCSWRKPDGSY